MPRVHCDPVACQSEGLAGLFFKCAVTYHDTRGCIGVRMKREFSRRVLVVTLFLAAFLPACATPAGRDARAATGEKFVNAHAIILVRHADIDIAKKATMGNATPLLPAGEARAKEIIAAVKGAGVTRVLTSPALRTQATGAPLAEYLHVKEENAGATASEVLAYLAQTAKPGETIVLVHHHSVIPSILAGFVVANETLAVDVTEFDREYEL